MVSPEDVRGTREWAMDGYGKRVLIVDRDEAVRDAMASVLEHARYVVYQAGHGRDAVVEMRKRRFDVVMVDRRLARLDGMRFLLLSRQLWPKTPLVMLSAERPRLRESDARQWAVALVTKPFEASTLLQIVHEACASSWLDSPVVHATAEAF